MPDPIEELSQRLDRIEQVLRARPEGGRALVTRHDDLCDRLGRRRGGRPR